MPHRKEEYEASGHDVTIQQVNEGGSPSAWIDGWAAHTSAALDYITDSPHDTETDISEKIQYHQEHDEDWKAIKTLLAFMCDCGVYFCTKCETFYDYREVTSTGYAGHKCGDCDAKDKHCPDNPDGDSHEDECLNPRQKHNARVATKYRCVHCGRKRSTTPTG